MTRSREFLDTLLGSLAPALRQMVRGFVREVLAELAAEGKITFQDPELLDADLDARFGVVPATSTSTAPTRKAAAE